VLNNIKSFFNQPYPVSGGFNGYLKSILFISLFIFCFLFFIKPFGLDSVGDRLFLYASSFALVNFIVCVLFELFIEHVLKIKRDVVQWNLGKWLLITMMLVLCISFFNYLLMLFLTGSSGMHASFFMGVLFNTFVVAFFPVLFLGAVNINKHKAKNTLIAKDIDLKPNSLNEKTIRLQPDASLDALDVLLSNVLFAQAMQNYAAVYYIDEKKVKKQMWRTTLTNLELELKEHGLIRCHRSYIVNPMCIENIFGNAQGLQLKLKEYEGEVPVSRKYIPAIKAL